MLLCPTEHVLILNVIRAFAALKRKGKGSDVEEADMEAVVHAHNSKLLDPVFMPGSCLCYTHCTPVRYHMHPS